jgi:hydrogenase maturation protease
VITLIGIANPDRRDDGLGWEVARRLDDRARVVLSAGDPARLIETWRHADVVVVVDATRGGRPSGAITVIDLIDDHLEPATVRSSHGMGVAEAVELSKTLEALPPSLTFVGVEGDSFEMGVGLTPSAMLGVELAVELIAGWCDQEGVS